VSFDKPTRTALARLVADCRRLLVADLQDQLQRTYGLQPEGTVLPLESLRHLDDRSRDVARALRAWQQHLAAQEAADPATAPGGARFEQSRRQAAFQAMALRTAFAVLNRLAALRLAEERGLVLESVRRGLESEGFQLFERLAGDALGGRGPAYRTYLERVGDELAVDLGALFDRRAPHSLLFPGDQALEEVLDRLNAPDLSRLWAEDETIGWIYQYFNPKEERDAMRAASQAPRSSRELAVRNQFFTPRYVVEFLSDNTLGRLWYEMRRGDTRLVEDCRYLVRRRRPVFLGPGEAAPAPFVATEEWPSPGATEEALWTRPDPDRDDLGYFWRYAATVDGSDWASRHLGLDADDLRARAWERFREISRWEGTFEELRCVLYQEWRAWRFFGNDPESAPPAAQAGEPGDPEAVRSLYAELCRRYDLETEAVPFRARKDPRALRILDPACGSGHFLLYSFDLLETVYREAWHDPESPAWQVTGRTLRQDYPDQGALDRAIPGLVLEHNLHGIDIDPRAVQIAALAMWLRAQKSYQRLGLRAAERPRVERSRFVCAEPMPGEEALLEEFCQGLPYKSLGLFVRQIFRTMRLAGEAGSLLKVEQEIERLARDTRAVLEKGKAQAVGAQSYLFEEMEPQGRQLVLDEIVDSTETRTWEDLETVLLEALQAYAERAAGAESYQRRLFAKDAAAGFGFVDLMRQRYDVVLMNPPFGAETPAVNDYLEGQYPHSYQDLFAAFVDRAVTDLAPEGEVGVISTEAGFFRRTLEPWRREVLLKRATLSAMAHLGGHVLDGATVRTACYTLEAPRRAGNSTFLRLLGSEGREERVLASVENLAGGLSDDSTYAVDQTEFFKLPYAVYGYWCSSELRNAFARLPQVEGNIAEVRQGLATSNDGRFLRLRWEVDDVDLSTDGWASLAKGGEFSPYHDDIHLSVRWHHNGREMKETVCAKYPYINGNWGFVVKNSDWYFRAGLTYPRRTNKRFAPRALPANCAFADKGPAIVLLSCVDKSAMLAAFNSRSLAYIIGLNVGASETEGGAGANSYEVGLVQRLPVPPGITADPDLAAWGQRSWEVRAEPDLRDEVTAWFASPFHPFAPAGPRDLARQVVAWRREQEADYDRAQLDIDARVRRWYRLSDRDWQDVEEQVGQPHHVDVPPPDDPAFLRDLSADLVQYLVGCAFGRWDPRQALQPTPVQRGPFDPLPTLPPGALQPGTQAPAAGEGLLQVPPSGLLVDDAGAEGLSPHPCDLASRVQDAARLLFGDRAQEVEHDLVALLGARSLRDWLRRPADFFAWHLKRYSKSRRQAPVYWPLSTESGSYTLWLYYPRLHPDLLYQAVNQFVNPKLSEVARLRQDQEERLSATSGHEATRLRTAAEASRKLHAELQDLRDELLRVAGLPYRPNLDDGVLISASPLWRLFRLPRWRKDLEACWKGLQDGAFDWSHLALSLRPDQVQAACRRDRSIALAHDLEHLYEGAPPTPTARRGRKKPAPT
jgi:hypothetical protein